MQFCGSPTIVINMKASSILNACNMNTLTATLALTTIYPRTSHSPETTTTAFPLDGPFGSGTCPVKESPAPLAGGEGCGLAVNAAAVIAAAM
jgi:hypothetical protein